MSSIGTFGSYTQARLAIYASQAGLSVTGNNIANINTYGYTRQRLEQSSFYAGGADRYYSSFGARTGNGVLCTGVSQLRDPYLDIRYRSQMSNVGAMDAKLGGLEGIQAILDEVSDGEDGFGIISAQLDKMYDALQQLTDQTGHDVYDTQVRAAADALAKQINSYANRLSELYNNTLAGYKQDVETVNNILSNIRDLNASIRKSEIHGDNALELRDERNLLIDQLSEYMKIDVIYTEEDIGAGQTVEKLTIRLGNANPDADVTTDSSLLVDGTYAAQFFMTQVPQPNPNFDPTKPPKGVDNFQYLKPDGSGTNNANLAQLIDSPNFDLTVSELRDSNGRLLYTMEKGRLETITEADYTASGGKATTVTDPDTNVTTITVFTKSGNQYYKQVYTKTPSAAVALDDNDLYGALQSERELLTEAGEYSTAATIAKIDENAAGKRGIPYYQKALDSLAVQLHPHVQVVLLPKPGDLRHHGGGVVGVQSLLISPAVDQQHSLRVLHGEEIGIPQVPCLCPDRIHDAADGHLLCEFPGSSAVARVIDIDSDCHRRILPVWFFQFYHRARVLSRRPSGPAAQSVSRKG